MRKLMAHGTRLSMVALIVYIFAFTYDSQFIFPYAYHGGVDMLYFKCVYL